MPRSVEDSLDVPSEQMLSDAGCEAKAAFEASAA